MRDGYVKLAIVKLMKLARGEKMRTRKCRWMKLQGTEDDVLGNDM
jgi:hypothetical protein